MSWLRRVQQAFAKPSSLKKTASQNISFVQKKYGDLAKDKGEDLAKSLKQSINDYETRARKVPESLKTRGLELGKRAQQRTVETTSSLRRQAVQSAKSLPSKAAEVAKQAATGAVAVGSKAVKNVASAGVQAAADRGRRVTDKLRDAAPKFSSYASGTGRRIVYVLFGTAFAYGVGSSLPAAVARYYTERDRRREEEKRKEEGAGDSLYSARVEEREGGSGEPSSLRGVGR